MQLLGTEHRMLARQPYLPDNPTTFDLKVSPLFLSLTLTPTLESIQEWAVRAPSATFISPTTISHTNLFPQPYPQNPLRLRPLCLSFALISTFPQTQ